MNNQVLQNNKQKVTYSTQNHCAASSPSTADSIGTGSVCSASDSTINHPSTYKKSKSGKSNGTQEGHTKLASGRNSYSQNMKNIPVSLGHSAYHQYPTTGSRGSQVSQDSQMNAYASIDSLGYQKVCDPANSTVRKQDSIGYHSLASEAGICHIGKSTTYGSKKGNVRPYSQKGLPQNILNMQKV